jgi:hypothetical protein
MKDDEESYFWDNNTNDLDQKIYGRYRKGTPDKPGHTVAKIIVREINGEDYVLVKLTTWDSLYTFSTVEMATSFIVSYFLPTIVEER